MDHCFLLSDRDAWLAQVFLFLFGSTVVIAQWKVEVPRRPLRVFLHDAMSLALGSLCAHFLNLLFVIKASGQAIQADDECANYILFYILDFALSTPLYFLFFKLLFSIFIRNNRRGICLQYSDQKQALCWVMAVCLGKVIVFGIFLAVMVKMVAVTDSIGKNWQGHRTWELWISTFWVPIILNSFQLLVTSIFLRQERLKLQANSITDIAYEEEDIHPILQN